MNKNANNNAISIRQKLLNVAKNQGEDFQQVLVRYALERLLYRLSLSIYAEQFVLKGALLFRLWFDLPQRPTRDADFLGFGEAEPERLHHIFTALVQQPLVDCDDGIEFLAATLKAEPIRKAAGYPGIRINLHARLANAMIPVQCDIGFGDAITPQVLSKTFPTLLDFPAPLLRVYPLETVIAEKLEAIVKLAIFNTRLKDYFDLWVLSHAEVVDKNSLPRAIAATFARRNTPLPQDLPVGLTQVYAHEKQQHWQAFLMRSQLQAPPLATVVSELENAYWPLFKAAA